MEYFVLLRTGNSNVFGCPKASESSNKVHSNTDITPDFELTIEDISINIKESQNRKSQWRHQLENKHKLEKDIETKEAYLARSKMVHSRVATFSNLLCDNKREAQ